MGDETSRRQQPAASSQQPAASSQVSRFVHDDYDRTWAFVVGILNLHLNSVGIVPPALVHESFRSCVDSYVEILAAQEAT
jgi:hypothetical protein